MISFHYELEFQLDSERRYENWIVGIIHSEGREAGEISYIFCNDNYLLDLHNKHLNKDTLTDIITFDYSQGKLISGDIFISVDRVRDNAQLFETDEAEELLRVMSHGILHMCGYDDKSKEEAKVMRAKENEKMSMFHVEQ